MLLHRYTASKISDWPSLYCMKYIIGLSKNPSAKLVQDVLICVHRNRRNVLFAKYSVSLCSHVGAVAKAVWRQFETECEL